MSSRRGSSNSFHSADGASSRWGSTEYREKFNNVDNLLSHQNTNRRASHHARRVSSDQRNNDAHQELAADPRRASFRRDCYRVPTPDSTQGASHRLKSRQAYSVVDLQDSSGPHKFRQVQSTVDLQDTSTRCNDYNTQLVEVEDTSTRRISKQTRSTIGLEDNSGRYHYRQAPSLDDEEGPSGRRHSRQAHSIIDLQDSSDRRHSRQALSLDGEEGTSGRRRSRQTHSTVDLQNSSGRRHFRQAQSTVDLQGTTAHRISRQSPSIEGLENISDRRSCRQMPTIDNVEDYNRRRNLRHALDIGNVENIGSQRSSRQALSLNDVGGTGRHWNSRNIHDTMDVGSNSSRRSFKPAPILDGVGGTSRRRNLRQALDTVDVETIGSRRGSRQVRSLNDVESTSRRHNSRNALDTVDVESNTSRRSSRHALSLNGLEGTDRRHNSRSVLDAVDVQRNSTRRSSRQALNLNGVDSTSERHSSRQALDTVDVESTGNRCSSRQAPASKYIEVTKYQRSSQSNFVDIEEAPPEYYSEKEPTLGDAEDGLPQCNSNEEALLVYAPSCNFNEGHSSNKNKCSKPDSGQPYSSYGLEGTSPRRDNYQEFSSEDAGNHVLSSDDPGGVVSPRSFTEENVTCRNVQQVYSSDEAASPRVQEPESDDVQDAMPKHSLRQPYSSDEIGRNSNQVSDDAEGPSSPRVVCETQVTSRRTSCMAFSSDDADFSRRTSCMGLASGDTGDANSDRSSIQALSSNEAYGTEVDIQDDEKFHDAEDGRSPHVTDRALVLPPDEVLSNDHSDGDVGNNLTKTRSHKNVEDPINPVSNSPRSFSPDEEDITEHMLSVYPSDRHTRTTSKKAHSFHGKESSHEPPKYHSQGDLRLLHCRSNQGLPSHKENDSDGDDVDDIHLSHRSSTGLPVVDEEDEGSQSSVDDGSYPNKGEAGLDRSSLKARSSLRHSNKRRSDRCSSSSSFDEEDDGHSSKRLPSRKARETASNKSSRMSFHTAKEKLSMPHTSITSPRSKEAIAKQRRTQSGANNKTYRNPKGPRKVSPSGTKGVVTKIPPNSNGAAPKAVPKSKGVAPKPRSNSTQHQGGKGARSSSNMSFCSARDLPCFHDEASELPFYSALNVASPFSAARPLINAAGVCFKCTMICKKENMIEGELGRFYCRSCYEKLNGSPRSVKSYPFSVHYSSTTMCTDTTASSSGLKIETCNDMASTCTKCVKMMNVKDMEKINNKYYCHPCLDKINSPGGMEEENKLVNETNLEKFPQLFPNPEEYVCLQPPSMEDRELISSRPLKCPKITCRKHVSITHIESHFRVEHREIPILTTKLGRLNTMEMLPNEINYGCKVIMLLNVDDYDFPLTTPLTKNMCPDMHPNELDRPNPRPVMVLLCARIPSDELRAYSSDLLSEHSFRPYGDSEEVPDVMPEDEKIIFWVASNMFTDLSYSVGISTRNTDRRQKFCGEIRNLEEVPIELCITGYSLNLLHYHVNKMSRKGKKPLNVSIVIHCPLEKKA